jgi:tetratricopeptide (TPR) repeat protein
MVLKEWKRVAVVLEGFRKLYPKNKLNNDITKKLAIAYKEDAQYMKSAKEFERIEQENPRDNALRREALNQAAKLYSKADASAKALLVYLKLVKYFPEPIEDTIEVRQKMADIYKQQGQQKKYITQLKKIVNADALGGSGRTDRTKFLAAKASLVLAEPKLVAFNNIKLVKPFKKNLKKKKARMRSAIDTYSKLVKYQVGEVTAAATFYIAEIYYEFNVALLESERPNNLNDEEMEEYELVIEDQAYPFEEKAISVHEKNIELLDVGIYNEWIDKSIEKLAVLVPARYGKTEQDSSMLIMIQPSVSSKTDAVRKNGLFRVNTEKTDSKMIDRFEGEKKTGTAADDATTKASGEEDGNE